MTYNIRVTRPSPSMDQDRTVFQADTYQEAVAIAHQAYRRARRAVTLGSGEFGMENWHRVDHSGIATDRNTNSGVLPKARVLELCEACDVLNGEVPGIPCTCGDTAEVFE